jgi:putative DNA modification/repair radical SAM protein
MDKLQTLIGAARFDSCGCGSTGPVSANPLRFIYRADRPGGGTIPLFKVLLTNVCVNDCAYCINQVGRDIDRCSYRPEELARLFMDLRHRRLAEGIFLSSGIGTDPARTQEAMVNTVEILRRQYGFRGYIHLKMLPGAPLDIIEAGCRLASRVSVNMEAPTAEHLAKLSRKKDLHHGILERMKFVKQLISKNEMLVPSGQTTQLVVGAADETDKDILNAIGALYQDMGLRRVYYSAFHPVSHSRLEGHAPTPPRREHRLYQADWLLRVYGFSIPEVSLALDGDGDLALGKDPKLIIARKEPWLFPVDINAASYQDLLRVPGIGPTSAKRIVEARRDHSIDSVQQLKKMRVVTGRALPFIWFKGLGDFEKQSSFLPLLEDEGERERTMFGGLAIRV